MPAPRIWASAVMGFTDFHAMSVFLMVKGAAGGSGILRFSMLMVLNMGPFS